MFDKKGIIFHKKQETQTSVLVQLVVYGTGAPAVRLCGSVPSPVQMMGFYRHPTFLEAEAVPRLNFLRGRIKTLEKI